jgi:hypothetical protein
MVASKTFGVVQVRSIVIALAVIAVLLLGALGLYAMQGAQTGSAAQTSSAKAFPYGTGDSHEQPAAPERTESHGPR